MSELAESLKEAFSFISERGVLGGVYIGSVTFGLLLANPQMAPHSDLLPWLAALFLLVGLIITSITYELLLPIFRFGTNWIARCAFKKSVGNENAQKFTTYGNIRRFRELFLASDCPNHLKERIKKDEKLRQTLTYFATSSIAGLLLILTASSYLQIDPVVKRIELVAVLYVLIGSLIGQVSRSYSLGRAVGLAFVGTDQTKRVELMK